MQHIYIDAAVLIEGNLSVSDDEAPKIIASSISDLIDNDSFVKPSPDVTAPASNRQTSSPPPKQSSSAAAGNELNSVRKIFLRVPNMNGLQYQKALNIVDIFEGSTQVIFYNTEENKYVSYSNGISLSQVVLSELYNIVGKENVVLK